ncbi:MAG: radical SAM protein, partial [Clostridia bacterium]|nr:radical SAM protein [Clostridia bacterium]
ELGEDERPYNIHLSGGEPTVRDDLPEIIKMGREKGFEYIQINTNGRRLAYDDQYAMILKRAGASVIYLQFDGTNDRIYETLRGEGLFEIKKKAIKNCKKARIPVVLVPTIVKNENLYNIGSMMAFMLENLSVVKGIHFQPASFFGRYPEKACSDGGKWTDFENRVTLFDVMHEVEKQTKGKFKYEDFAAGTIGHPLCSFHGTYRKQKDGTVKNLVSHEAKASASCCNAASPVDIMKKNRDYVLNKWNLQQEYDDTCCETQSIEEHSAASCCESEIMTFDQFIAEMKNSMFTVSGMAFQDISNLDAQRLKRCRVQVLSPDNRLIPFCAYNSLYRK